MDQVPAANSTGSERTFGNVEDVDDQELTNDHWVSRGYQQNFSSVDKRVAVIDAKTGAVIHPAKPIKTNFRERGFTTFMEDDVAQTGLEAGFAAMERTVLNQIRQVSRTRRGDYEKAAVANLFAIHLVRSPSFKNFHAQIAESSRTELIDQLAADASAVAKFTQLQGRPPRPGELSMLAHRQYEQLIGDPWHLVESTTHQHDQIAGRLNEFHMQVIEIAPHLPGFVVGDTPVTHADPITRRYGFRDRLAIGDSTLIVGPLARRTAVAFTATPLRPVTLTTRRMVDTMNAVFIRNARSEIASHPDDAKPTRQAVWRRDRNPPELLTIGR